jgi:hypothetical protein
MACLACTFNCLQPAASFWPLTRSIAPPTTGRPFARRASFTIRWVTSPDLSVLENLFLGDAPRTRAGLLDWPIMWQRAARVFEGLGVSVNLSSRLGGLGKAQRQQANPVVGIGPDVRPHSLLERVSPEGTGELVFVYQQLRTAEKLDATCMVVVRTAEKTEATVWTAAQATEVVRISGMR